jgi:hypothetical protein
MELFKHCVLPGVPYPWISPSSSIFRWAISLLMMSNGPRGRGEKPVFRVANFSSVVLEQVPPYFELRRRSLLLDSELRWSCLTLPPRKWRFVEGLLRSSRTTLEQIAPLKSCTLEKYTAKVHPDWRHFAIFKMPMPMWKRHLN